MANRLITFEELAADWDRMIAESGIDPKEFVLAVAYITANAFNEEEERQVRVLMGLEDD